MRSELKSKILPSKEGRSQLFSAGYGAGAFGIEIEDLTLKRGEITTLIGENGCGKSTFLKSLAGILPYRGHALMDGEEIADLSPKARAQRLAYLPQSLPAPRMTVRGGHHKCAE